MSGSGSWQERDRKVLWHPFTQHELWDREDFPVIVSGEGVYLIDADGNRRLDGVSSLWLNVHGHHRPEIEKAIADQLGRIAHSTFLGQSHPPGIKLAEKLVELSPEGLTRVFFSDDGSTAMEIALKMAYQYWCQQDPPRPDKRWFVKFANAYHGDTLGSVSVGGIDLFHATYGPLLFPTVTVPSPYCHRCPVPDEMGDCEDGSLCLMRLEEVLDERGAEIAGVVIEPMVQGAAGMLVQPEGFMAEVEELCDRYGVLLICDEVATGFGRTGRMFACEWDQVEPDIMAIGKGLSGGYLPIAATMATEEIFDSFRGPHHSANTFFHGHSYTANQLGCAASIASLSIFENDKTLDNVRRRSEQAMKRLLKISDLEHVGDVRQAGLMIGIELEQDAYSGTPYEPSLMMGRRVTLAAREKGLIVRPLGDVVVLMPPLCVSKEELDKMLDITGEAIEQVTRERAREEE